MQTSSGIHHITAITSDPQMNVDFYEGFLGQRLVKRTVNFDDPRAYHLYFADSYGAPGTLLTFFYWRDIPRGVRGVGEVSRISYRVKGTARDFWKRRAEEYDVPCDEEENEFGEEVLVFTDPDGLVIELVLCEEEVLVDWWDEGPIPEEFQLQGFFGVTLTVVSADSMYSVLHEGLGYTEERRSASRVRFLSDGERARVVDVVEAPSMPQARQGSGSVHHVAFRAEADEAQLQMRSRVIQAGMSPTPVIERNYFRSVYFMTPGRILFEIATDGPGFMIDESTDELGENLVLPPQFEPHRDEIERSLPPLTLPRTYGNEHD